MRRWSITSARRRGTSGRFNLSAVGGRIGAWDASSAAARTPADGALISALADRSGAGHPLSAAAVGGSQVAAVLGDPSYIQTTGGNSQRRLDAAAGVADRMWLAGGMIAMVIRSSALGGVLIGKWNTTGWLIHGDTPTTLTMEIYAGLGQVNHQFPVPLNAWVLIELEWYSTTLGLPPIIRVNGAPVVVTTTSGTDGALDDTGSVLCIGNRNWGSLNTPFAGDIGELLFLSQIPSKGIRSAIRTDMMSHWGITPSSQVLTDAVYLSPNGNDAWSGKYATVTGTEGPVKTLERARDVIRAAASVETIVVAGGDYTLPAAVQFTSRDAGVTIKAAPGATPVFHGGVPITGWTDNGNGQWSAPFTPPAGTSLDDLFVNGVKQTLARFPSLPANATKFDGWLHQDTLDPLASEWEGNTKIRFKDGDIPVLPDSAGLSIWVVGSAIPGLQWIGDVLPVAAIDYTNRLITTFGTSYLFTGQGNRYFLQGRQEFLDSPGEWWFDGTNNILHHIPSNSATFASATVRAGLLPTLVRLTGADGMTLRGLEFRNGSYVGTGKLGTDARGGGAVRVELSDNVKIYDNVFNNTGVGVHVEESDNALVAGNTITDIAGNGLYLGTKFGSYIPSINAKIVGNTITNVGTVFADGSGIYYQAARNCLFAYNEVTNCGQFGIAGGSHWGDLADACYDNVVEHNIVTDANQKTCDGAGIKVVGEQSDLQNCIIRYNKVVGTNELMTRADGTFFPLMYEELGWPEPISWAYYTDVKACGILFENNIAVGNITAFGLNGSWNAIVRNNIAVGNVGTAFRIDDGTARLWFPEWRVPNRVEKNVVSLDTTTCRAVAVYAPGNLDEYVSFGNNIYWDSVAGALHATSFRQYPPIMNGADIGTLAQYQAGGEDVGSINANPLFTNAAAGNYTLQAGSPAFAKGFVNISTASLGRVGYNPATYGITAP